MILADTSTLVAYLEGLEGSDVEALDWALQERILCLPPVVVTEVLSDPSLSAKHQRLIAALPQAELQSGYWERAGRLRRTLVERSRKARLGDVLVAQAALDANALLIARDRDFSAFEKWGKLKLFRAPLQ